MKVHHNTPSDTFRGDEGETITLTKTGVEPESSDSGLEMVIQSEDYRFRATLEDAEVMAMVKLLSLDYRDGNHKSLTFYGTDGEELTLSHDNRGDPYRVGIDFDVEGAEGFPDYAGPFVESDEVQRMVKFIAG